MITLQISEFLRRKKTEYKASVMYKSCKIYNFCRP